MKLKNDFLTRFIIAKTVYNELFSNNKNVDKLNLNLIDYLAHSVKNYLEIATIKQVKSDNFYIYKTAVFYLKLLSNAKIKFYKMGISANDYDENIDQFLNNKFFKICFKSAISALNESTPDRTFRSTHFHENSEFPAWANGQGAATKIENYLFYNNII